MSPYHAKVTQLQAISTFKQTWSLLDTIYLVEASPTLRDKQRRLLCGDKPMIETDIGFQSHSKLSTNLKVIWVDDFRMIPKGKCGPCIPAQVY